eukprot:TRINITY_DN29536_c0_g2_i2.p1 TRINITY_DN29536_c0_g2~~TRINITY_DN29536_c0_g2_i2.p1  ORF type:complete len:325 (+),score=61.08 TRINITY_DN29536_c0_g2_i2:120-977(+)
MANLSDRADSGASSAGQSGERDSTRSPALLEAFAEAQASEGTPAEAAEVKGAALPAEGDGEAPPPAPRAATPRRAWDPFAPEASNEHCSSWCPPAKYNPLAPDTFGGPACRWAYRDASGGGCHQEYALPPADACPMPRVTAQLRAAAGHDSDCAPELPFAIHDSLQMLRCQLSSGEQGTASAAGDDGSDRVFTDWQELEATCVRFGLPDASGAPAYHRLPWPAPPKAAVGEVGRGTNPVNLKHLLVHETPGMPQPRPIKQPRVTRHDLSDSVRRMRERLPQPSGR